MSNNRTDRYTAAIVGAGHIAEQNHVPAIKQLHDRVMLTAVCSRDINKAWAFADKHGIPQAFDNFSELLDGPHKPDIIINCTANNLHYPFTMQALEKGCHVFCEKPPAITGAEAREMAALAKEKGKVLAYNFLRRQSSEYALLKKYIHDGEMGQIYHIKADFLRRRGIPGWGNFTNKTIQGGGALIDLGVHILDLALGLVGYHMPDRIVANNYNFIGKSENKGLKGAWDPAKFEVEDACFAYLSFPDNSSIVLSSAFALNQKEEQTTNLHVFGTKAGATLHPLEIYKQTLGELSDIKFPVLKDTPVQLANTIAFLDACDGKASNICTAEQGAVLQSIIEGIYQSANLGSVQ